MKRVSRWVVLLLSLGWFTSALGTEPNLPQCPGREIFTASPIALGDIASIFPLGGLSPPSHVFPTDHTYFVLHKDSAGTPLVVPLYSPGVLMVTAVMATEQVNAGFADYRLELQPCDDVTVVFMHVSSLDDAVFGDTSSFLGWSSWGEYTTGSETYRMWRKGVAIEVQAGQRLGAVGGRRGQNALDVGVYDSRWLAEAVANPERWRDSRVLTTVCPFDYYAEGEVKRALLDLIDGDPSRPLDERCAAVFQDVPGTAKGCWFAQGVHDTYPEDPHLALVTSNTWPGRQVLSVGISVPGLPSRRYEFTPQRTGRLNRAFEEISPDGVIYGYDVDGFDGVIIVTMPDAETLWIEALSRASTNPATWRFTARKATFER